MRKAIVGAVIVAAGIAIVVAAISIARNAGSEREPITEVVGGPVAPGPVEREAPPAAVIGEDVVYTPEDVAIFERTMSWAREEGLDTLAIGEMMARLGRRFVGATYTPQTLELPGPERVVVNLREFDCVTYLESMLAMARVLRDGSPAFGDFAAELRRIRYRGGILDGYASRLHYFSEWIYDNTEMGLIRDITVELGGIATDEPIDFMSSHADAYPRLDGRPEPIEEIRQIEQRLSARARSYIPEDRIAGVAQGLRNGDIIAATSSIDGLDVAHTGMALWVDGRLHLMHAPLVGKSVEISTTPLAERIRGIDGQDGIMVARPL